MTRLGQELSRRTASRPRVRGPHLPFINFDFSPGNSSLARTHRDRMHHYPDGTFVPPRGILRGIEPSCRLVLHRRTSAATTLGRSSRVGRMGRQESVTVGGC